MDWIKFCVVAVVVAILGTAMWASQYERRHSYLVVYGYSVRQTWGTGNIHVTTGRPIESWEVFTDVQDYLKGKIPEHKTFGITNFQLLGHFWRKRNSTNHGEGDGDG